MVSLSSLAYYLAFEMEKMGLGRYVSRECAIRWNENGLGAEPVWSFAVAASAAIITRESFPQLANPRRNKPSIDFYVSETVGAKLMDGWVGCRVDGEKLDKLAEQR